MFDINCSNLTCHLRRISADKSLSLSALLPAEIASEAAEEVGLEFRNRIFTPFLTLYCFLSQVFNDDHSCRNAVAQVNAVFLQTKRNLCSFGTSSYCKAKARLPLIFLKSIARKLSEIVDNSAGEKWRWKHGRVLVVDGTGFSMPDTRGNSDFFLHHPTKNHEIGFPVGRLLAVFSLATGGLIDAVIAPWTGKGNGEPSLLNDVWNSLRRGDTLLGDCLYSSYWIVAKARKLDIHIVSEFRKKSGWRLSKKKHDQIIVIRNPSKKPGTLSEEEYNSMPSQIRIRVINLICAPNGFRPKRKTIMTTHLNPAVTAEDICALYKQRWQIEINLRSIKTVLGMDVLRGKSHEIVKKEVWVHLIAYNLIRLSMIKAAILTKKSPLEISFRATSQALCIARFVIGLTRKTTAIDRFLIMMLSSTKVGNRPDRYEPRILKRRKKNFSYMNKPRELMRKELCKKNPDRATS